MLTECEDKPHEVANLLKEIILELTEPVIPYDVYEKFRDDLVLDETKKVDQIIELLGLLPELNLSTLMHCANFFG